MLSQFIFFPDIWLLLNTIGSAINLSRKPAIWCPSRTQSPVVKWKRPSDLGCQAQRSEEPPQSKVAERAWNINCGHKVVEGLRICAFAGHAFCKDWCIYSGRMFILPGLRLGFETWDLGSLSLTCLFSFGRSKLLTSTVRGPLFPW